MMIIVASSPCSLTCGRVEPDPPGARPPDQIRSPSLASAVETPIDEVRGRLVGARVAAQLRESSRDAAEAGGLFSSRRQAVSGGQAAGAADAGCTGWPVLG